MHIDWSAFTPASALAGGVIIGTAAALLALVNGRVAGISGIVGGLLRHVQGDRGWRIAFVLGLLAAPLVAKIAGQAPLIVIEAGWLELALAGVLVGYGTRLGSGCTSGHGVCGVSRLSPRSLVATAAFMASGFATVFVLRHLLDA